MATASPDLSARAAYEALAQAYDVFTAEYAHDAWLQRLELLARRHGLAGRRVLDVGCGTGSSFLPLVERGYQIVGCDISAAMLARARERAPQTPLHLADVRDLPTFGEFDLVTCLDDVLNYVTEEEDLVSAFDGIRRNLGRGGLAIWDLNTALQYARQFESHRIVERDNLFMVWAPGNPSRPADDPGTIEATINVFCEGEDGRWERRVSVHRQRPWSEPEISRLAAAGGLRLRAVRGQRPGAVIDGFLDERVHTKVIYLASIAERGKT
jgi:SAM-dependent methyltransferase